MSLSKVNLVFQKTLPAVFDDSLTYYEAVSKLVAKINELVTYIEVLENQENEYTDAQIANLKKEIDQTIVNINAQYNQFTQYTEGRLSEFNAKLNQQDNYIDSQIDSVNARTDAAISANNVYIFDQIAKDLIDVKVINYFTGELVTIQEMFDYLCQFHLTNAITYSQLSTRQKTYDELAALNITYTELAINGGTLIPVT